MAKTFRYADDTDDDTFDSDGLLRDGERHRVPLFMRNSSGRAVTLTGAHNLPIDARARKAGYVFTDTSRDEPSRAIDHAVRRAQLSAAYRGGLAAGDFVTIDGERFRVLGYTAEDRMVIDADEPDAEAAYETAKADLADAWKRPRKGDDDDDDDEEHKSKRKKRSDMEFEMAGPLSDADVRAIDEIKRAAYLDSVEALESAWKR